MMMMSGHSLIRESSLVGRVVLVPRSAFAFRVIVKRQLLDHAATHHVSGLQQKKKLEIKHQPARYTARSASFKTAREASAKCARAHLKTLSRWNIHRDF